MSTGASATRLGARGAAEYGAFAAGVVTLYALALRMSPSPSGIGTHTQLGLPSCLFLESTGVPCPACGMTTAFVHFAHGHAVEAIAAQPFGALFAAALLAGLLLTPLAIARGVRPAELLARPGVDRASLTLLVLFLLAWAYKIAVWMA